MPNVKYVVRLKFTVGEMQPDSQAKSHLSSALRLGPSTLGRVFPNSSTGDVKFGRAPRKTEDETG